MARPAFIDICMQLFLVAVLLMQLYDFTLPVVSYKLMAYIQGICHNMPNQVQSFTIWLHRKVQCENRSTSNTS